MSGGRGAELRAGLIAELREMDARYGHLHGCPFAARIERLENRRESVVEPAWAVWSWLNLPSGQENASRLFRLDPDDRVVEVRYSGDCIAGPGIPCSIRHDHYLAVT